MTEQSRGRQRWLIGAVIVSGVLGLALVVVVFLVLTGIVAEPETVIESIVRTLIGQ